jgi:threonine synthase
VKYVCSSCEKQFPLGERIFRCSCGGFLEVASPGFFSKKDLKNRELTIWRYREAFGLPGKVKPVSLGEGRTPILQKRVEGIDLLFKLDFLQPSGSFKDRGASLLLSLVRHLGIRQVVEDSSGNAGAAISAYSAAAGIGCTVYVPAYTPDGKLTQMKLYGSEVVRIPGKRQDANQAVIEASKHSYYASHLWHPLFVTGLQSAAFEIWEQLEGHLPERILLPVGGGGFLEGIYRGFVALKRAGYVREYPKIIGVQAEKCPPIHRAFQQGLPDFLEMEVEATVAEGIAVQRPPRARAVLKALRESGGFTIAVQEEEILAAEKTLFSWGLFSEPTSASAFAGWLKMPPKERRRSLILLTGNGLKETRKLAELFLTA